MRSLFCLSVSILASSLLLAADQPDKPDLTGKWQLDASKSELHGSAPSTLVIEEKDGKIHITATEGARKVEWNCSTMGTDCAAEGDKAKASFWYNGPMLVEFETRGDNVTRYRMKLSPDRNSLEVDVASIVPKEDKTEKLVFTKQP